MNCRSALNLSPSCGWVLMPKMVPPSTLHAVISYAKTNALPNIWHRAKMKVGRINLLYFFNFTYGIVSLIAYLWVLPWILDFICVSLDKAGVVLKFHFVPFLAIFPLHSPHLCLIYPIFQFSTFKGCFLSLFTLVTVNMVSPPYMIGIPT